MTQILKPNGEAAPARPVYTDDEQPAPVRVGNPTPMMDQKQNMHFNVSAPAAEAVPVPQPFIINQNTTVVQQESGCVCGIGWGLFIAGWFFGIPWFVGAIMLCCKHKQRERPGLIACAVASGFLIVLIIVASAARGSSSNSS